MLRQNACQSPRQVNNASKVKVFDATGSRLPDPSYTPPSSSRKVVGPEQLLGNY
jgi:hypothetical protein